MKEFTDGFLSVVEGIPEFLGALLGMFLCFLLSLPVIFLIIYICKLIDMGIS